MIPLLKSPHKALLFALTVTITLSVLLCGCGRGRSDASESAESYYDMLDAELTHASQYQDKKEADIALLKRNLKSADTPSSRLDIIERLVNEYESYISDSAMHYIDLYMQEEPPVQSAIRMRLRRADIMSHAGLFQGALDEMRHINRADLDSTLLEQYYYVYCGLYQYMGEYNDGGNLSEQYVKQRLLYTDSLMQVAPENSFRAITYRSSALMDQGKVKDAINILHRELDKYESGTRPYAILASILAYAYKCNNDDNQYKKYLTLSAISDVKSSTKENMAFRELASALYDSGNTERAKHYLQKSFDDANFYSARMRVAQSARMLPVIDTAYDAQQSAMQNRLKWMLLLTGTMAIVLIVAICFILKQMRSIRRANKTIREHNDELSRVSQQLKTVNEELAAANDALKQSDSIKEEYAGLFMQFSSLTISNLEQYQRMLLNLATKGNTKELVKKIDSSNIAGRTLKDFYNKFDEAILNIYPNFVEKVNALLQPDGQIYPKPGSKLNTELRVLALLRIGINDSDKIAAFLRCSLTTVYTYRSKIRKRAINPDSFEQDLLL